MRDEGVVEGGEHGVAYPRGTEGDGPDVIRKVENLEVQGAQGGEGSSKGVA